MDGYDVEFWTLVNSVLNVNVVVSAFNQEKSRVGAFSMIVKISRTFVFSSDCNDGNSGNGDAGLRENHLLITDIWSPAGLQQCTHSPGVNKYKE